MLCLFYLGLGVAYYLFIIYYLLFINRESSSCFVLTFLFMVPQYCVGGIFRFNFPIPPQVEICSYKVFSLYQSDQKFAKAVLSNRASAVCIAITTYCCISQLLCYIEITSKNGIWCFSSVIC